MTSQQTVLAPCLEDQMISMVMETFNRLASQQDLSPNNPVVNDALSRYVDFIVRSDPWVKDADVVLSDTNVRSVMTDFRHILSTAEFEMEQFFARSFSDEGKMPLSGLSRFWYRANYKALVDIELNGLKRFADKSHDPRPMAFIGSGPLPLSAIDYHLTSGRECVCIEMDEHAANDSRQLIENVGLENPVKVVQGDGAQMDYSAYSIIFVAALVQNKDAVLDRIRATAKDAIIGVRSADGLIKLLYAPVDIEGVESRGFSHCGTTFGTPEAVNSTCFFKLSNI